MVVDPKRHSGKRSAGVAHLRSRRVSRIHSRTRGRCPLRPLVPHDDRRPCRLRPRRDRGEHARRLPDGRAVPGRADLPRPGRLLHLRRRPAPAAPGLVAGCPVRGAGPLRAGGKRAARPRGGAAGAGRRPAGHHHRRADLRQAARVHAPRRLRSARRATRLLGQRSRLPGRPAADRARRPAGAGGAGRRREGRRRRQAEHARARRGRLDAVRAPGRMARPRPPGPGA